MFTNTIIYTKTREF